MFDTLLIILKSLAPILPTTMEEAYKKIPYYDHQESIFLERINNQNVEINFDSKWVNFEKKIRPKINILIEQEIQKKKVKRSNELILYINKDLDKIATNEELAKYLLVAKVKINKTYKLEPSYFLKCDRCWNYFDTNKIKKNICVFCSEVLRL